MKEKQKKQEKKNEETELQKQASYHPKDGESPAEETSYDLSNVGDAGSLGGIMEDDDENKSDDIEKSGNTEKNEKPEKSGKPEKNGESKKNGKPEKPGKDEDQIEPDQTDQPNPILLKLLKLATSIIAGETSEEELRRLLDAASAAEAIEKARMEGEIAGRNAAIEERMIQSPAGPPDLSGTPDLSHRSASSIFDLARTAK